eukprot:1159074-Pelagomonas_calceolata.AAC.12
MDLADPYTIRGLIHAEPVVLVLQAERVRGTEDGMFVGAGSSRPQQFGYLTLLTWSRCRGLETWSTALLALAG